MTRLETLQALKSRIAEAKGPDREIDALMWSASLPVVPGTVLKPGPAFTSSLDAVVALIERKMPGTGWCIYIDGPSRDWPKGSCLVELDDSNGTLKAALIYRCQARHESEVLARLGAFISALIAKEQSNG